MSRTWFVSPTTRSEASETKATNRPSALIDAQKLDPLALPPFASTLARKVFPDTRSRTNTSDTRFVSFGTRLPAVESKATNRPCPSMVG